MSPRVPWDIINPETVQPGDDDNEHNSVTPQHRPYSRGAIRCVCVTLLLGVLSLWVRTQTISDEILIYKYTGVHNISGDGAFPIYRGDYSGGEVCTVRGKVMFWMAYRRSYTYDRKYSPNIYSYEIAHSDDDVKQRTIEVATLTNRAGFAFSAAGRRMEHGRTLPLSRCGP